MSISAFPHHYHVELDENAHLSLGMRATISGGIPPQFGGDESHWSPEELLVGAAGLCLMTTFQTLARRENFAVVAYRSRGDGTLEKTREGLAFTSILLFVELVVGPGDEARALELLQKAKKHCIIANSLKCPVELQTDIHAQTAH